MYVPCILYNLLSKPTNAQHIYNLFHKGTWQILRGIWKYLDILEQWQIKIVLPKKRKTDYGLRKLANHSFQNL